MTFLEFGQMAAFALLYIAGVLDLDDGPDRRPLRGIFMIGLAFLIFFVRDMGRIGFRAALFGLFSFSALNVSAWCLSWSLIMDDWRLKRRLLLFLIGGFLLMIGLATWPNEAKAICPTRVINPITDICWDCMYPIKIGSSAPIGATPTCDMPILGNSAPVCSCPAPPPVLKRTGMSMSFWEPARMAETVTEPWCFPSIGSTIGTDDNQGYHSSSDGDSSGASFKHVHWLIFPADMILSQVLSTTCMQNESMDILMVSEIDPLWTDDQFSAMIQPEAVLFANPLAQFSCAVDAVASNVGCSNSLQPWCMGSWGSAYPLTGNINDSNDLIASAGLAAKMLYRMGRTPGMTLMDPAVWNCMSTPTPVWVKHHYRFQPAMPILGLTCNPLGRSDVIWGVGSNPPYLYDNNVFLVWRQRGCCAL